MKSSAEQVNPVQYRVNVEVPSDQVDKAFQDAYLNLQKKANIKGFRPGKAPLKMIRKMYGSHVSAEVGEQLINSNLRAALDEQTLNPVASPVLEHSHAPQEGENYHFTVLVDTLPQLEFEDYKGITVTAETFEVGDEAVDGELEKIRRNRADQTPVEEGTPAAKGHQAVLSHSATLDGQEVSNFNVEKLEVVLGKGELLDGLENAIVGLKAGDATEADVKVPDDYEDEQLAGKTLHFSITLHEVNNLNVPDLDDEFAKDLDFESLDALKQHIRDHLQQQAEQTKRQRLEQSITDKILEKHPFEVPPAMVDRVIDSMIDELPFPEEKQKEEAKKNENMRERLRESAKHKTRNTLLLWHVSQKENIEVSDEEVDERLKETLAASGMNDPKQLGAFRQQLGPKIRENLLFEKAMNVLIENANITEIPGKL